VLSCACLSRAQSVVVPRDSVRAAPEKDILKCRQLQKGLYRSYEEFRHNAPSITRDFAVISNDNKKNKWAGNGFSVEMKDTLISPRIIQREMWGFCDGKTIFVNAHNFQRSYGFHPLLHLGRYAYLEGIDPMAESTEKLSGVRTSFVNVADNKLGYLLNLNNGKFYPLHQEDLEKILSQDPVLFGQFQREDKRGDKATRRELMFRYVKLYNERHPEEIK
jgi:hypothetical protein